MTDRAQVNRLSITRGELLMSTITVIMAISGYWISTERRITILEAQMKEIQIYKVELKEDMKDLKNGITRIELLLKDKADKK
jgi:hypothetical protein